MTSIPLPDLAPTLDPDGEPAPASRCERVHQWRALAAELRHAIAGFGTSSPAEVAAQAATLGNVCGALAGSAAAPAGGESAALAEMLTALQLVTNEVRQLNQVYAVLVGEARRTTTALLAHLGGLNGTYYAGHAGPERLAAELQGSEVRVSS